MKAAERQIRWVELRTYAEDWRLFAKGLRHNAAVAIVGARLAFIIDSSW